MQGSDYVAGAGNGHIRCDEERFWIPLNGPGFDGGSTGYLSPCMPGMTCIQGSAEHLRDAPLNVSHRVDNVDSATTLLTWSGSHSDLLSLDCARDIEIPSERPTTWFSRLLLR
jgi:hypothetical protein